MTLTQAIIAYAVSWWMIIFMAAPIHAAKTTDENRKKIWAIKLAGVTFLAGLVTWGICLTIESGAISVK